MSAFDVIVVGAGPTGLACAIEAKRAGLTALVIDKGCVVNSLYHYPTDMTFFTTPDLLEIGDLPMVSLREKPTRTEALKYYRLAAEHYKLEIRQYEKVIQLSGSDGQFHARTERRDGSIGRYESQKLILATGYYDIPNQLGVPGEDLPKVHHYYREAHPFYNCDVAIIGARNSAAIAALELYRHGARVTLIHRSAELSGRIKYWIKPDIENRIKNGEIKALFDTKVVEIRPDSLVVAPVHADTKPGSGPTGLQVLKNDFVLAMIGYQPDTTFLNQLGVTVEPRRMRPYCDPTSLESNVQGLYLAGVVIAGLDTNEIFIENGRHHGKQIVTDITAKLGRPLA
jgi:thioredoxin reductase (NADPH)